ncbi:unnamed protein product [Staurois parvus]|uniref:Uncharacterized protein n=1 Tax=Staurois parvus TaxID=386267 RepID=A0ABN9CYK1_9NEOB|nr:unnamed protein product [Staurois parvus]
MRLHNTSPSVWTVLIGPVLITCTLPRKKTKLSMCSVSPRLCSISR